MPLKPVGIQKRSATAILGTAALAFLLIGLISYFYQQSQIQSRAKAILTPYADIITLGAATLVDFDQKDRCEEILGGLAKNSEVVQACIFKRNSAKALAAYPPGASPMESAAIWKLNNGEVTLLGDTARLAQDFPVFTDGEPARLIILLSLSDMHRRNWQILIEFGLISGLILIAITLMQLMLLRRWVLSPLAQLTAIAESARTQSDYSQRMPAHEGDELGVLGKNFNSLLATVEQREAALRQLNFFQNAILNSAAHAIISTDPTGRITSFNPAAERILGWKAEEMVGCATPEIFHDAQEVATRAKQLSQHFGETIPSGFETFVAETRRSLPSETEWTYIRKDGRRVPVILSVTAMRDELGNIYGFLGNAVDISERKFAEQRLRHYGDIIQSSDDAIISTTLAGRITSWNRGAEEIFGYPAAMMLDKPTQLLLPPELINEDEENFRRIQQGESIHHLETRRLRHDGALIHISATISPIRENDGKIIGASIVARDITRNLILESQLRQAQKMDAIGTLAGGIAHDFNNILAVIFSVADLLQMDAAGNPEAMENVAMLQASARRAKDLVQQILTFSRKREQSRQIIQLDTVVKEAGKFLRSSLPSGILIDIRMTPDAPPILADPTQVYQVVLNLATNAFHAMEGKHGNLTICLDTFAFDTAAQFSRTNPDIAPGIYTRLRFTDTGVGMSPATIQRIFEPFFTTKAVGKGTGLGLAMVHGIMCSHEGHITVESEIGKGTTFTLYFPAQKKNKTADKPDQTSQPTGTGQTILVVDDEKNLTNLYERLLRRLNYEPAICNTPAEALKLFQANSGKIAAIITDLTMPGMGGIEFARHIRKTHPHLPIILATGFRAAQDEDIQAVGICQTINKPFNIQTLALALAQSLEPTDSCHQP